MYMERVKRVLTGDIPDTEGLFQAANAATLEALVKPTVTSYPVALGSDLLTDLAVDAWIDTQPLMQGSRVLLRHIVRHPTTDIDLLRARVRTARAAPDPSILGGFESTLLWLFSKPQQSLNDEWPLPLLFPSWPILRLVNSMAPVLAVYHMYRCYAAPMLNLIYPISTIVGPWVYIRRTMRWPLSFITYLRILYKAVCASLRPTSQIDKNAVKYVSLLIYIATFVVNIVQTFAVAVILHRIRTELQQKIERVAEFDALASGMLGRKPVGIAADMSGLHELWTNRRGKRTRLANLLRAVYAADIGHWCKTLVMRHKWCVARFASLTSLASSTTSASLTSSTSSTTSTSFAGMGHPALPYHGQVRNPCRLDKSMIITGPNAAGKSTYMKAIAFNSLLAQTLGICCAYRAHVVPVHMIGSFIRVHDTIGRDSLFQAEVARCRELVERVHVLPEGQRALVFLDEPMHSTPPVEGAATAMAVCKYLGDRTGVKIVATTHYHTMVHLDSAHFANVGMQAIPSTTKEGFTFPYRIHAGASFQCIAIELLESHALPRDIVESAIEMKNKICNRVLGQL